MKKGTTQTRTAFRRLERTGLHTSAWLMLLTACDQSFEFDVHGTGGAPGTAGAPGQGHAGNSAAAAGAALTGGVPGASGGEFGNAGAPVMPCGMGPACPSGLYCVDGACHACAIDDDCVGEGFARCDPLLYRCVECIETTDCTLGFRCDALARKCLQSCAEDDSCPPSAHGCDRRRAVCFQCDEDEECAGSSLGSLCAVDGSGCVQCRNDTDCEAARCDGLTGRCVECRDGSDCSSGLCEPSENVCLPAG